MPERTKQFKIYLLLFLSRQILFAIVGHASVLNIFVLAVQVVAGGGAVEAALSVYLENLATTLGSREQLAIAEFAESLLIIPKVLT
jgi:chaperonin GroEL (HSP60 family)